MIKYFSNCYIHKKEARSRLFKMQDLPSTYVSIPQVWIPAQLVLSIDTNLPWILLLFQDQKYLEEQSMFLYTLKHMPYSGSNSKSWPLTLNLSSDKPISCCQNVLLHHGSAVAIVWTNQVSIFNVGQRTLFTVHWSDCCFQRPGHVSYVIASLW